MFYIVAIFYYVLVLELNFCLAKDLLYFPVTLSDNNASHRQPGFIQINGNQSNMVLTPTNISINDLLKRQHNIQNLSGSFNHVTSWVEPKIFRMIGKLGATSEDCVQSWLPGSIPATPKDDLVSILKKHRLKRIAIIAHQAKCNTKYILDLVRKMNNQFMNPYVLCLQETIPNPIEIWYALQQAIFIKMSTIVLYLPTSYSIEVINIASRLNMLSHDYVWISFNLNQYQLRTLEKTFPDFHLNNLLVKPVLEKTMASALKIQKNYEKKYLKKRDVLIITNNLPYRISPHQLHVYKKTTVEKAFLRFVTLVYYPLVFPLKGVPNEAGHCEVGMTCRLPVRIPGSIMWQPLCCTGLIIDFLANVIKDMNIEYDMYIVEDGSFGGYQNGSWTGIMHDVYTRKADVGVHVMSVLNERLPYVDFTVPILVSWFGVIRRNEPTKLKTINWIFLTYLQVDLVITLLVVFVLNFGVAFIFENAIRKFRGKKRYKAREVFSYLSSILFQRDQGAKQPSFWSSRLPCLSYAMAMTVVMSSFTANLTAKTLIYLDTDDFKGLADPKITNPTEDFKFSVVQNSGYELYMKKKPHLYDFVKHRLVPNDYTGLNQVMSGTLDAYIGDWTFLKYLSQLPKFCNKLKLYKETKKSIFSAFVLPKNSPWKEPFSQEILNTFETNTMSKLLNKWIWYNAKCEQTTNEATSFPWTYFGGLFLVSSVSVAVAFIVLLFENLANKFWRSKKTTSYYKPEEMDVIY